MLLLLSKKIGFDEDGRMALSVTRQELADMTGTTVETAIRVTTRWQKAGLISASRSHIQIANPERLEAIARGDVAEPADD
jgi:CRP/FNR family transcriptional regulator